MTNSIVDAESVLAIDIGSVNTRALLFDVVDSQYAFVAAGTSSTTTGAPYHNPNEGAVRAIRHLQEVTGRDLLGAESKVILPSQSDGAGVDRLVVTFSAGQELRVAAAGLLADVSLESAQRLAASAGGRLVESIGLNDRRRPEEQLDILLKAEPEIIILAGGTEGGASRSMGRLVDLITLLFRVLPAEKRPEILFTGNQALAKRVGELLGKWTAVHTAPNVRPSIDVEDLAPAQVALDQIVTQIRTRQMPGLAGLASLSSSPLLPTAFATGRVVRFLSRVYNPAKGVLALDLGANNTVFAAGNSGRLNLSVSMVGMGQGLAAVLQQSSLEEISRWIPMHIPDEAVREYIWQKAFAPGSLPVSVETLAIEQALARQALRLAWQQFTSRFPGLSHSYEPILAGGATLGKAPSPAQALLMLLDGLQPSGITTLVLDQNGVVPALGVVSDFSTVLPVQVLESGAFLNLGTIICPITKARYGSPVMEVRMEYARGNETNLEIRQGSLTSLPLKQGQQAVIHLRARGGTLIDPRSRKPNISFKITGGACGAVIDARGRPIVLPPDAARRRDLLKKWSMAFGS